MVTFTVTLSVDLEEIGSMVIPVYMPAGEPCIQEIQLPITEMIPAGIYTLCIEAELGEAVDTACATITLNDEDMVTSFAPLSPTGTDEASWGAIKSLKR